MTSTHKLNAAKATYALLVEFLQSKGLYEDYIYNVLEHASTKEGVANSSAREIILEFLCAYYPGAIIDHSFIWRNASPRSHNWTETHREFQQLYKNFEKEVLCTETNKKQDATETV